ncbi:MAG: ABC transporter permease subunit, partial [Bdellovibrionales bacterium]|nr:ABC transporter permease subunit [Bdellovibrionales bacterium]
GKLLSSLGAKIGFIFVSLFMVVSIFAPVIAPHDYKEVFTESRNIPPVYHAEGSAQFLLGTDDLGRDIFSRLVWGAPVSMGIGFCVVLFSLFWGILLALLAGTLPTWVDNLISRFIDILMSMPSMLMAIVIVSILGPSLLNTIIAVGIVSVPQVYRLVRSQVLLESSKNYVIATKSFGANWWRVAVINILPNCMAVIIVQATLGFSDAILNAAALGFLGLGAQPPTPEWGTMLADARAYIESSPWMVTAPGLCILILVISFNLLGDALRDYLDPKLKK